LQKTEKTSHDLHLCYIGYR